MGDYTGIDVMLCFAFIMFIAMIVHLIFDNFRDHRPKIRNRRGRK